MTQLMLVKGYEGKTGKGARLVVAASKDVFGVKSYGVWVLCENYKNGRNVKTWRYISEKQTKEDAIITFNKRNKS